MTSRYEQFQQRIFDQLDELELENRQRSVEQFVALGKKSGIDVISEILDKGKSAGEVLDLIKQAEQQESSKSGTG
jgi:hypothetical protein